MQIKSADFIISNTDYKLCPKADKAEYAFIGRSNVGKSSLINLITRKKHLAKISRKPGKTQLINHFLINKKWYLVDLPGYGYATVSKTLKEEFQKIIFSYLENRGNLMCLFVLLDCRHKPQKIDLEFMKWLGEKQICQNMLLLADQMLANRPLLISLQIKNTLLKFQESPGKHNLSIIF